MNQAAQKKGMGPLGWILIGCGGLVVIAGIVFVVLTFFVVKKGKEFAHELEKNPKITMAKAIAWANPDIEFVNGDNDAKQVTFRYEKTGEEFTVDYADINNGKLTFKTKEGTTTFEGKTGEDGESGSFTVSGPEGTSSYTAGKALEDVPAWVPMYPGTTPQGAFDAKTSEGRMLSYSFVSDDALDDVLDFYKSAFEDEGFDVQVNRVSGSTEGGVLIASRAEPKSNAHVTLALKNGQVQAALQVTEGNPK